MTPPLVSAIVPCHDLGRYLDEAVDSVLAQSHPEVEIIVVDDGSTDEFTRELLADYRRPKTRVVRSENRGVMHARNLGIADARGEHLCALDADDRLDPSFFEKAVRILARDDSIAFVSCWLRTFGDEEWTWRQERCDLATLLAECTVATPSVVRKAAVVDVGGFDERMPEQGYEDWDLWLSLVERGYRGTILPEVLFHYRRRAVSVSRRCEEPEVHLRLMRYLMEKHRESYREHLFDLAMTKDADCVRTLTANYTLERQIHDLRRMADLRREEASRVRVKRNGAQPDVRWARRLDELETEALRHYAAAQDLARERGELARRVGELESILRRSRR